MVIIPDKDKESLVYISQNIYQPAGEYDIVLRDRATNDDYEFHCADENVVQNSFYTFRMDFSDVPVGEYEYEVKDSENWTVSKGIIRLNRLENDVIEYYAEAFGELEEKDTVIYETED